MKYIQEALGKLLILENKDHTQVPRYPNVDYWETLSPRKVRSLMA
jgi:hypothetical protein